MGIKKSTFTMVSFIALSLTTGCEKKQRPELPNPASVNCIQKGGTLHMVKNGSGGTYGVCIFEKNRQCEEWALFRGECPQGGVDITGYVTPQGLYCAIKGGQVEDKESHCQLPSGKNCSTQALHQGTCP